jgi:hypothetical protein
MISAGDADLQRHRRWREPRRRRRLAAMATRSISERLSAMRNCGRPVQGGHSVLGAATNLSRGLDGEWAMDREAASALASADRWFRYWMPYRLVRLGLGDEHVYLPVNRGLKPLGVTSHSCFRFDAY